MAKTIFKVLMNLLLSIASLITTPVNAIIRNDFPNFATQLQNFANLLNRFIGSNLTYFIHILPSGVISYLIWIIDSLIILFTISITAHTIIKVISLIKRVKVI